MMKPTNEQLIDPKWWDENAPSDAQHVAIAPDNTLIFYRQDRVGTWQIWGVRQQQWMFDGFSHDAGKPLYEIIPRPTKPAAPEWNGEGLPFVGCECEISYAGYWVKAKVVHSTASGILVIEMFGKFPGKVHISVDPRHFRPLRTKEQRQRDELAVEIWSANGGTKDNAFTVADHILSRYNLEPKD